MGGRETKPQKYGLGGEREGGRASKGGERERERLEWESRSRDGLR